MNVDSIVNFIKVNAKALVVFVAGLVLNAVTAVINGDVPWPTSLKEWGTYLGTSVVAGLVVWATGNRLTEKQVIKGAQELGIGVAGAVADQAIQVASDTAKAVVSEAASNLPKPARDTVNNLAETAGQAVDDVLRNFRPGR
jgi:hypothetical protein